ncbi:signal recognition particle protein Srp19 [Desulfurococcus amylolyticus]|uniref:Signal recognition particle 19 kDa protein n=1 Tax=Desulfurococcus amylolyticus DSM 16532 TaxID=768672 RepID=I3XSJ5_DESAM|nr:signal recognition particle protein Srp19 [Desulfurococcus amylolyticus]AFL66919.1 Ribonucleoprotein complex SRP, Srp19 component [Desulfurococcus amylolyticus DSM 16532]
MSRDNKGRRIVVYPAYIDSKKSRSEGRKISLSKAVPNPSIKEIIEASERLGLNPLYEEKHYPRLKGVKGRVLVDKKSGKLEILRMIADEIRKMRGITG